MEIKSDVDARMKSVLGMDDYDCEDEIDFSRGSETSNEEVFPEEYSTSKPLKGLFWTLFTCASNCTKQVYFYIIL